MQWITLALLLLENDAKTKIQSLRTYYSKELTKERFGRNRVDQVQTMFTRQNRHTFKS